MNFHLEPTLSLIQEHFKTRNDVFAIFWQKGNKSGFMPAYYYDPYRYRLHLRSGGNFKNYKDKSFLPLIKEEWIKHLKGEKLIGVYPLFPNNSSSFIAADFDKENWKNESKAFIEICQQNGIPAYLERSRSGNGGHVWIFFDKPYPAIRSRKIVLHFLEKIKVVSSFNKNSSFDRLFPNQDFHSGKGLGNLIALPFYKPAFERGNSCFIDLNDENLVPFQDQVKFLHSIKKTKTTDLDIIYISINSIRSNSVTFTQSSNLGLVNVVLKDLIYLKRSEIPPTLTQFLKEELNFNNPDFFIKKNIGKSTWKSPPYFSFIEELESEIILPRGFIGKLLRFCKSKEIKFKFIDKRVKPPKVLIQNNIELLPYQMKAFQASQKKDFGIITAPPGSGKTVIGLKIISDKQLPSLIIVHRTQLLNQWVERIEHFLNIPKKEIGKIGQGKNKQGKIISVALIQSLGKWLDKDKSQADGFGTIIIDECHHFPAETYRKTISQLSPYFQYGLTSTPFRKGDNGKLIRNQLGEIISEIIPGEIKKLKNPEIIIRRTQLEVPFDSKIDHFEVLSKILIHDSNRNQLILSDVRKELKFGNRIIIITERVEHIEILNQYLKKSFEVITFSGADSNRTREEKWKLISEGKYQILITTGQLFGEGIDLSNVSRLFLVYPFSFKGKLIQYIGRVQRSGEAPVIYDYQDCKIDYLNRLFLKRNVYYRKIEKQTTLFKDQKIKDEGTKDEFLFRKKVFLAINQIDFCYGLFAFKYHVPKVNKEILFEIENNKIRPEFNVLKPYFFSVLNTKKIDVTLFAEFENGDLVSQEASSFILSRINDEIIEGIKFKFLEKKVSQNIIGNTYKQALLDGNELQGTQSDNPIYLPDDILFSKFLENDKIKHFKQLKYLAAKHQSSLLKLRFVLNPFSFVFLISGKKQFHIILETLDTEEATYVWHFEKNVHIISNELEKIEKDLNYIKNRGRVQFLKSQPQNFSRVMHNYGEDRKGFIIWKDILEEKLN